MTTTRRAAVLVFIVATIAWTPSHAVAGQETGSTPGTVTIDIDGVRPLNKAVARIGVERQDWIVTYEELPPEFSGDMVDVSTPVQRDGRTTKPHLINKPGKLRFSYRPPPGTEQPEALLTRLLSAYRASDPPLQFQLQRTDDVFHVVARGVRDARGVYQERKAPLDMLISFPEQERTLGDTLVLIAEAVEKRIGYRFMPPAFWLSIFSQRVTVGAQNEAGRSVLLRTLQLSSKNRAGWVVWCSPDGPVPVGCAMNVWFGSPFVE